MTDFRELCAELVTELEKWCGTYSSTEDSQSVINRARAALAEPEPVGPTDKEIMELMPQQMRDDLAAAARALSGFDADNIKAASAFRIILNRHCVDHARAALARWGRPAPQPVPVSERLPKPGDCNSDREVWAWRPFDSEGDMDNGDFWCLAFHEWLEDEDCGFTHWLPAHALPVPNNTSRSI